MTNDQLNQDINPIKRPDGLTLLCVLSFIGGGMAFISNFTIYAAYSEVLLTIENEAYMTLPGVDMDMLSKLLTSSGRSYYLISSILYVLSLMGVHRMWKLKKHGIHFYAIAQISLLIIPLVFIDRNLSVLPSLVVTAAFIYLYSRYLKLMQ